MTRDQVGRLTPVAIWVEFAEVRCFANSPRAIRFIGLDITVTESDDSAPVGYLAREGPPDAALGLHEAAMGAIRPSSHYPYYLQGQTAAR